MGERPHCGRTRTTIISYHFFSTLTPSLCFSFEQSNYATYCTQYLHDAGQHSVSLWTTRLLFLQLWTIGPSTNWKLANFSCSSALSFGPVGLVALLGASWPFRPLSDIAVFGNDAGLESHWHFLLGAQTEEGRRNKMEKFEQNYSKRSQLMKSG